MRSVAALVVTAALLGACTVERTTETIPGYPVSGMVFAGPTCAVETDPPDPACAARPVAGAHLVIMQGDTEVGEVVTDSEGRFSLDLPEGDYVVVPQPVEGFLGTADQVSFTVGAGLNPEVQIAYDTGIR
jgi:hypothetical protein